MLSPSELEGEVDHSFFDSDGDDGGLSGDRDSDGDRDRERSDKPPAQAKQTEKTKDVSPRAQLQKVNESRGRVVRKEDRYRLKEEDDEEDDEEEDKRGMASDALSTDDERLPSSAKPSKSRKKKSKKGSNGRPAENPRSSSPENIKDADSESNSRCSGEKKGAELSAASCSSEESVTDVSPLSTPERKRRGTKAKQQQRQEEAQDRGRGRKQAKDVEREEEVRVPSSGRSNTPGNKSSDACSVSSESQLEEQIIFYHTGAKCRKNYSFSNDQVRCIDRENQRLLRALSCFSAGTRAISVVGKNVSKKTQSGLHTSSSKINRQREQKRIDRENLAMLKRLEATRPTQGMRRRDQLADYRRQVEYLEPPSLSCCVSSARKDKSAKKSPEPPRSATFTHHIPRVVSATTASSSTSPLRRSETQSASPPPWH